MIYKNEEDNKKKSNKNDIIIVNKKCNKNIHFIFTKNII